MTNEMITVIDESDPSTDDFYIVSKKFEWLISECHEDVVYFVPLIRISPADR